MKAHTKISTFLPFKGITMLEVVIVMGILALAIIPIYQNIFSTRINVTRARFSYIALHLAREKMEELMSIPYDELKSRAYEKVSGPVVSQELLEISPRGGGGKTITTIGGVFGGGFSGGNRVVPGSAGLGVIDSSISVGEGDYPAEYQRFERRVEVKKKGKRFKHVRVTIRWFEKGANDKTENKYMYQMNTLIANHHLSAYK